jgi:hypothetical protein
MNTQDRTDDAPCDICNGDGHLEGRNIAGVNVCYSCDGTGSKAAADLARKRDQFCDMISNYSEDRWCAGWLDGVERAIREEGGLWDDIARICGWPLGYRGDEGWEPFAE